MRIGIPKDVKKHEHRVALVPNVISELTRAGYEVLVERGAGIDAGFADDCRRTGASLSTDAAEVFGASDMIVEVKEPQAGERVKICSHTFTSRRTLIKCTTY
jgi:alanine dehydrogenase